MITKNEWNTIEMPSENETFKFERAFSVEEIEKLKKGFRPKTMEDKWFVYYENEKLYMHRSWGGTCIFIMSFNNITNIHTVIVNKNPKQYKSANTNIEIERINNLINRFLEMEN